MAELPSGFPFHDVINRFIREYRRTESYWYVPKTRSLSDTNLGAIRDLTRIIGEEFAGRQWNPETQDLILARGRQVGVLEPYVEDGSLLYRTALVRIWKKFLELLGPVWIREGQESLLTPVGTQFLNPDQSRLVLEQQIGKYQYPNPGIRTSYARQFLGLAPHVFLLQAMRRLDYHITVLEYNLFINLARSHTDLDKIVRYILTWRDLHADERRVVLTALKRTSKSSKRYERIAKSSSYGRAFLTYPHYLAASFGNEGPSLVAVDRTAVDSLVDPATLDLKISQFATPDEWFAYYGDPEQHPSWYTYLKNAVEIASTEKDAKRITRANRKRITDAQAEEIERLQIEKGIEDFYATRLPLIEPGLKLIPKGRQYTTPIGRIDLLCSSASGDYVVVEIKAAEATDAVFGQILRYIGWVHRNLDAAPQVRGVILASEFPETARYSRIGLLKHDAEQFIQFKQHGLTTKSS